MNAPINPKLVVMNLPRRDATDKITGRTHYTVDRAERDMLQTALVRSTIASGRIVSVDYSRALTMKGVRAIATSDDALGLHGIGIADQPLFAADIIRYNGEPIAAIAADTIEIARAAAYAVVVKTEPLPKALTMADALSAGAPLLHPAWKSYEVLFAGAPRGGNVAWEARVERGDTSIAFARKDVVIIEDCFSVGRQNQMAFEPRCAIARFEDGRFHIEASTQVPWTVRNITAKVLGIPSSRVRVTVPPVGGGFGLKFDCTIEPIAAILAKKTGRTVAIVNSREEENLSCLCRENAEVRIRSAVTQEGEIVGREATVLMDCGAYGGEQVFLTTMTAHTLGGNYRIGSIKLNSRAVYTNTPPNGAFRACNGVYNTFFLERHTDNICTAIGMDPMAFRKLNVIGDGDIGATGQVFHGDVLRPMLEKMETFVGVRPSKQGETDKRLYGSATTVGTWFIFVGASAATVNLNLDGSATLVTSGVEIGSGTMVQSLPQIVAATLGIDPSEVIVKEADTDGAGRDLGVGGGRTTVSIGAASKMAAESIRTQILETACELLQTPADKLILSGGKVEIIGRPGASVTISQVVQRFEELHGPLSGTGNFTAPTVASLPGCAAGHFIEALALPVFAVHHCDVAVDPDTGHVDILGYRVVQDVGLAINPRAIMSQVQGGVVQGLGYALHEEITLSSEGAIEQSGFEHYRLPLAGDVLPVEVLLHEGAPSIGPLGAKGAGEIPILNVGATVACAVARATNTPVCELPLTPPRVLALLQNRSLHPTHPHILKNWQDNLTLT